VGRRKICVITGTRAEYGLLIPVMKAIQKHPALELSIIATGMHLLSDFGDTVADIERDGFSIDAKVPMYLNLDTPGAVARGISNGISGIAQALEQIKPAIIVVLGDRDEPLAAAIAGAHMNIPVAHIHGGDRTGCIDDSIRHAISRFAHIHFPATQDSADRLIRMGEEPRRVHVIGPLGIYAMRETDLIPREELGNKLNLNMDKLIILALQHPVTTQANQAAAQMRITMEALAALGQQTVVIYPNADAGGRAMIEVIEEYSKHPFIKIFKNLPYFTFVSLMAAADVVIGNSSSALVDAPLFGLPAVNIGSRQGDRQKGANITDVPSQREEIIGAVKKILNDRELKHKLQQADNPYNAEREGASKIADILGVIEISEDLLQKKLTY
jgi:GDP/UDP-N,N'-diacetylbacillosamine 2-epimerase (hydrolysing)